ncbi:hypothetical protein LCGC14_0847030 [marine sediment metagenome]|uniref:Uncharacterized protein n=1 Tax=marine sediment metagenome TaxID=412755 RepID=A0A0F9SIH4_9ZZZZ
MAMSARELIAWQPPPQQWIMDHNLLVRGGKMVAIGSKKSFKSMLITINLAFALANGTPWLGKFQTVKSKVLVVQCEIPQAFLRDRVLAYALGHPQTDLDAVIYETARLKLNWGHDHKLMKDLIDKHEPDVLMLDPMYKLFHGDINSNEAVGTFFEKLEELQAHTDNRMAIVLNHHKGKQTFSVLGKLINRGSEDSLGASYIGNWLDTGLGLKRTGDEEIKLSFDDIRLYHGRGLDELTLKYLPNSIDFVPIREEMQIGLLD